MYYVEQSDSFEAIVEVGISGLVGTISCQFQDNIGNTVYGPSTASIIESPAGSGFYQGSFTAPANLGQYSIIWSEDGSYSENHVIIDDLTVVALGSGDALPPLLPIGPGPSARLGPCNAWTTVEDIAACCSAEVGSDLDLFDEVNSAASQVLFELSGRQYAGNCEQTVRPCDTDTPCGFQVLSRGHLVGYRWYGENWGVGCGCPPISKVTLAGYPVREVIEVKIDGVAISSDDYELKDWRNVVAKNGMRWPGCQRQDLDDTEEGTWSIRYSYGQNPPWEGQIAARELACELYKSCDATLALECALPSGVTQITRQGITITRNPFTAWGRIGGIWRTGMPHVDLFLNTYNPSGARRRPVFAVPGRRTYPLSS